MSVLKSHRGTSGVQFLDTARDLEVYTLARCMKFLSLTDTGRVVRRASRRNITTMRRKLKKFRLWVDDPKNKFSFEDARISYTSWQGHIGHCNSWYTRERMEQLYQKLFEKELKLCTASPKAASRSA